MSPPQASILFVSWAPFCSRSDSIARELGGSSVMIYHKLWGSNYVTILFKYFSQSVVTGWHLLKRRPKCVLVMSPPPVACVPVLVYASLTGIRFIIDAHSAAFVDTRWRSLQFLQRFFARRALTTLVTNAHWQSLVESWNARSDIVPDVPVEFPEPALIDLPSGPNIAVVSTFTFDEPTESIFKAAALVPAVAFHITGDFRRVNSQLLNMKPSNVYLTGFLPDAQYVSLLKQCTAVMSLTTLDHTMQRGGYEAAYLGRPIITSDFAMLRHAFPRGTVFVHSTPDSIAEGVRKMCADAERFEREARELSKDKYANWRGVKQCLTRLIADSAPD